MTHEEQEIVKRGAELARLRVDLTSLRAALDYANGLVRYEQARRENAEAKVEGLNLAADQYSESRDQWMLKAKAAETAGAALLSELEAARAVVAVARTLIDEPAMHAAIAAYDGVGGGG